MGKKWQSERLYEHPAEHQKGKFGRVALGDPGAYYFLVGDVHMSCPQDWAAKIHADEMGEDSPGMKKYLLQVPEDVWTAFRVKTVQEGVSVKDILRALIELWASGELDDQMGNPIDREEGKEYERNNPEVGK